MLELELDVDTTDTPLEDVAKDLTEVASVVSEAVVLKAGVVILVVVSKGVASAAGGAETLIPDKLAHIMLNTLPRPELNQYMNYQTW